MENGYSKSTQLQGVGINNYSWFGERIMIGKRGAFFMVAVMTAAAFHVLGLYGMIAPVVENQTLVYMLCVVVFGFVFGLEHFRSTLLRDFLDSKLINVLSGKPLKNVQFFMFTFITAVLLSLTVLGAVEGVTYYNELKKKNYITSSLEYKSAKAETDSRVRAEQIHDKRMEEWREDKAHHDADCNSQWSSEFRTMRAKCKENFRHQPSGADQIAVSSEVDSTTIKSLESKYDGMGTWTMVFAVVIAIILDMVAVFPVWEEYFAHRDEISHNPEIMAKYKLREDDKKRKQLAYVDAQNKVFEEHHGEKFEKMIVIDKYQSKQKLKELDSIANAYQNAMNVIDVPYEDKRPAHVTFPNPSFKEPTCDPLIAFIKTIFKNGEVGAGGKTMSISEYLKIGEGKTVTARKMDFTRYAGILKSNKLLYMEKEGMGYKARHAMDETIKQMS